MKPLPSNTPQLLQDLYNEVYQIVRLELAHSALSMMSVLLEATVREIIKKKRGKYPTGDTFTKCIDICKRDKILSEQEGNWLKKINDLVRNSYLHHDVERMAKNIKLKEMDADKKKDFDRMVALELFPEVDKFFRESVERYF